MILGKNRKVSNSDGEKPEGMKNRFSGSSESNINQENVLKSEMNQQGQTLFQLVGFAISIMGLYLILMAFKIVTPPEPLLFFLLQNPLFDNALLFFLAGLGLIYLGYLAFNQ